MGRRAGDEWASKSEIIILNYTEKRGRWQKMNKELREGVKEKQGVQLKRKNERTGERPQFAFL